MTAPPNPGSTEAVLLGCLCPILDNHSGRCAPVPPHSWYVTEGCPVHAPGGVRVRRIEAA